MLRRQCFGTCKSHWPQTTRPSDPKLLRHFTTSFRRTAQGASLRPQPYGRHAKQPGRRLSPSPYNYESPSLSLAKKTSPTLLYQSATGSNYTLGCYALGAGMVTMGLLNSSYLEFIPRNAVGKDRQLPTYVPYAVTLSSACLVGIGCWLAVQPSLLIRSIRAVPKASKTRSPHIMIEIERLPLFPGQRFLPGHKPRIVQVKPTEITMSAPIWKGKNEQVAREMAALEEKEKRAHASGSGNILSLPFRQAGFYIYRLFNGMYRAIRRRGMLRLHVSGQWVSWHLDHRYGWALNEGEALDKLVSIKKA